MSHFGSPWIFIKSMLKFSLTSSHFILVWYCYLHASWFWTWAWSVGLCCVLRYVDWVIVHNSYVKLHIKRHDWHFTFPKGLIVATSNTENLYAFRMNVLCYNWQIYFYVHLFTLFGDIIYYSRDSKAWNNNAGLFFCIKKNLECLRLSGLVRKHKLHSVATGKMLLAMTEMI